MSIITFIERVIIFFLDYPILIPIAFHLIKSLIKISINCHYGKELGKVLYPYLQESGADFCFINISLYGSIFLQKNLQFFQKENYASVLVVYAVVLFLFFLISYSCFMSQSKIGEDRVTEINYLGIYFHGIGWIRFLRWTLVLISIFLSLVGFFGLLEIFGYING